jgi:hypothetical protein
MAKSSYSFGFRTFESERIAGPDVRINCRACGRENTPAKTVQVKESAGYLHVQILHARETRVKCKKCGVYRLTRLTLDELADYSAHELEAHLWDPTAAKVKLVAIAGLLLFCFPFIGLVMSLLAFIFSFRSGGWPKVVSLIGTVLSLVISALTVYALLTKK